MQVAITGGTGFLGCHLARQLLADGHKVLLTSRGRRPIPEWVDANPAVRYQQTSVTDRAALQSVIADSEAVAHLAGINFERGDQTYAAVHRRGTENVALAADATGVDRLVLASYLRARPATGSGYLDSKWAAEGIVRAAETPATVLKPAGIFGPGDQLLTNLARWLRTIPVAPRLGLVDTLLRPVAVDDVVRVAAAAVTDDRLAGQTVAIMGPESLRLTALVERIGAAIDRRVVTLPAPEPLLSLGGWVFERALATPLLTRAGVRMLAEGMTVPAPSAVCRPPPAALTPRQPPSRPYIEDVIGDGSRVGLADLAW